MKTTRRRDASRPRRSAGARVFALVLASVATTAFSLPPPTLRPPMPLAIPPLAPHVLTLSEDEAARMTVPVMIDGKGPFPFVIDTGADRTVISSELAGALRLPPGAPVMVHGTGGDDLEPTARIKDLAVSGLHVADVSAPTLAARNLGAAGMLGLDALRDKRVVIDLRQRTLAVEPSRMEPRAPNVIVVHAKSRYGQLILVDAAIRTEPIAVILDTGAQNTIGNAALERLVGHVGVSPIQFGGDVISVTGRTTPAFFSRLPQIEIGGIELGNQPVAFADLQTFAQFGLTQHPSMLLGMDTLRLFERVVVDFGRKEVRFTLGPETDQSRPRSFLAIGDAR